ncbi:MULTISPECIES: hypothetical protein [Methylotenera]|uniref:hypothetical protein n=1 Tax=Methylotenera TaxID=359407 RepID=UPI00035E77C3|nr:MULTISPECIES: hypothetical protein [Methylotenera]
MISDLIRNGFFGKFFERISTRNLLISHFAINSLGLIAVSIFIASTLANILSPSIYESASFYSWAKPTGGVGLKLTSLLQYVLSIIALLTNYGAYLLISKSMPSADSILQQHKVSKTLFYFIGTVFINVVILSINLNRYSVFIVLWLLLFCWFPFYVLGMSAPKIAIPRWIFKVFFVILLIQYTFIFLPLVLKPMVIKNDYINISERTILKSGKVVDNLDYINAHKIAGLQISDPRKSHALNETSTVYSVQRIESCQLVLKALISVNNENEHQFFCDKDNNFVTKTSFSINEKTLLATLELSKKDKESIDKLFINSMNLSEGIQSRLYNSEERDFLRINAVELVNQSKAGSFLYHHGYNFGVMNALNLGATPYSQTMVYGWLSTTLQAKLLKEFESSNYHSYFRLFFANYLVYFAVFLLSIFAIFKRFNTLFFATLLTVTALVFLGRDLIHLASGFNPIRHFFDAIIFYFFYQYLKKNSWLYFICALMLSLFSILWSKDFGLFITLSLAGAIIFKGIKDQKVQTLLLVFGVGLAIIGLFFYLYPFPGANPTAIYMLLGVGSPQANTKSIFILLVLVSMLLYANVVIKQNNSLTVLSVAMAFYFVQSLTYYIWYPQIHHILGVAPVFIFWLTILFHGLCDSAKETNGRKYSVLLISPIILIYALGSINFYWKNYVSYKAFNHHKVYEWSFDTAKLKSTMDPMLFEESVKLIKKYSTNQNAIFIISKYDHILPILANKYSAMPYNELLTNIVSPKEAMVASNHIFKNNPDFVYVDTDIDKNLNGELPVELDPATIQLPALLGEAKARIKVMQGLKEVYALVETKYELCETGRLISVYCRKQN